MSSFLSFVLAHYREGLIDVSVLIAAASVFIKALEKLVSLLVGFFPSLKAADDRLLGIARLLDLAANSKVLNLVAMSPAKAAKLLVLVFGLAVLTPAPAQAAGFDWSAGPTVPLLQYSPGSAHPVSVAPGAGLQFSLTHDVFKRAVFGKSWDLLDLDLMAFGSVVTSSSGQQFGQLSAAAAVCTLSSLFCLGAGHGLIDSGGAVGGRWFLLFAFSFNFALAPSSPPAGVESGAAGLPRANTLYFGAP